MTHRHTFGLHGFNPTNELAYSDGAFHQVYQCKKKNCPYKKIVKIVGLSNVEGVQIYEDEQI